MAVTNTALNIHDYLYHGPDPDMALSRYRTREEAALNILFLIGEVARLVEGLKARVKPRAELETALEDLKREMRNLAPL